ncbi:MAG: OmpH family outer membrane protein [Candidatus Dadabacteria bacterium]|nr:MAG: OmpH family outer membrane protein [Candidatus Dadabacteria bacterium]
MTKLNVITTLACFIMAGLPGQLFASPLIVGEKQPLYVVDMQKVIDNSIAGKALRSEAKKKLDAFKKEFSRKQAELAGLRKTILKQSSLMSEEARAEKVRDFRRRERELADQIKEKRDAIIKQNSAKLKKLVSHIDDVIKELAVKNNYALILEKDGRLILHVNNKYDLTDKVLKILNTRKTGL